MDMWFVRRPYYAEENVYVCVYIFLLVFIGDYNQDEEY